MKRRNRQRTFHLCVLYQPYYAFEWKSSVAGSTRSNIFSEYKRMSYMFSYTLTPFYSIMGSRSRWHSLFNTKSLRRYGFAASEMFHVR